MSESESENIQVLLPEAKVVIFSRNKDTVDTFMTLQTDWRFARVKLDAKEGDVDTAIAAYDGKPSPDLVIVETETINDGFSDQLEDLADNCSEGTAAIVIGPVNDVNLYRKLVGMGVSDYIVRPVHKDSFGNNIAETLLDKIGAKDSRIIAVAGSKGGVGTTSVAQILALGLSEKLGQKTFLLDTAGGWSTLSVSMDFEPAATLSGAVKAAEKDDEDGLARMLYKHSDRLHVLSSGIDAMLEDTIGPDDIEELLDYLMVTYPVLIVDISASNPALKRKVLSRANEVLVVTTPSLTSLRAARTFMQEISTLRGGKTDTMELIVNMQGKSPKYEVSAGDIKIAMEREPSAILPFMPDLFIGMEGQDINILEDVAGLEIAKKLLLLANKTLAGKNDSDVLRALGRSPQKKAGLGQFLEKLKAK